MNRSQYVVITDAEDLNDGHVPFVQRHMNSPFIAIDPFIDVLAEKSLSFVPKENRLACLYKGRELSYVVGVWLRRPTALSRSMIQQVHMTFQDYAFHTLKRHVANLYDSLQDAFWVSNDYAIEKAEHKPLQLIAAHKVGFRVPKTLFTSNPDEAKEFVKKYRVAIVKSLGAKAPQIEKDILLFFSTRITAGSPIDYSNLHLGPAIFQQAIDTAYDLRITVIGEKVFTAVIEDDIEQTITSRVRDWRVGMYAGSLKIQPFDSLPKNIEKSCIQLVRELGLASGMIDMVVDKQGAFWFLEINPNGQWAFVEDQAGLPIGKALAELLMSKDYPTVTKRKV